MNEVLSKVILSRNGEFLLLLSLAASLFESITALHGVRVDEAWRGCARHGCRAQAYRDVFTAGPVMLYRLAPLTGTNLTYINP